MFSMDVFLISKVFVILPFCKNNIESVIKQIVSRICDEKIIVPYFLYSFNKIYNSSVHSKSIPLNGSSKIKISLCNANPTIKCTFRLFPKDNFLIKVCLYCVKFSRLHN